MTDTSKIEMTITARAGRISLWEKIDDQSFLRPLFDIYESSPLSMGELLAHAFRCWLLSPEGVRITDIIQGTKEIEGGGGHDVDDVIDEIEGILRGDADPGDED